MNFNQFKNEIGSFFGYLKGSVEEIKNAKKQTNKESKERYDVGMDDIKKAHENIPKRIGYGVLAVGFVVILGMVFSTIYKQVQDVKKQRELVDNNKTKGKDIEISIDEQGWKHYQSKRIDLVSEKTNKLIKESSKKMAKDSKLLKESVAKDMNTTLSAVKKYMQKIDSKLGAVKENISKQLSEQSKEVNKKLKEVEEKKQPYFSKSGSVRLNSDSKLLPPPIGSLITSSKPNTSVTKNTKKRVKEVVIEPDEEGYDYSDVEIDSLDVKKTNIKTALLDENNESKKKAATFHIMKGVVKATLLTGISASTFGGGNTKNPSGAVVFSVDGNTLIANNELDNIGDCLISGSATGNINTSKADVLLTEISCSGYNKEGKRVKIEQDIKGWVLGEDGSYGLKGRLVDSSGKIITKMIALEIIKSLSQAIVVHAQPSGTVSGIGIGATNNPTYGNAAQSGLGTGVKRGLDNAFNHYNEILTGMYPTISVRAGKKITLLLKGGEDLSPSVYQSIDIDEEFEVEK